jgi:hypothetical protein
MPHPTSPIALNGPRSPGRPPKPPDEVLHVYTVRLKREHCDKLHALGGRRWVAQMLDAARMPRGKR